MKLQYAVFLCFSLTFAGFHQVAGAQEIPNIQSLIENSSASNAFWSVQVRDENGQTIENLNGSKLVRPASNFKLVSSAAFLSLLGSDYVFETPLYGRGELDGDVWRGDLIVRGMGDPTINGEFSEDDPLFLFEKWYQVLDSLGIRSIDGNLIGNSGLFDDIPYPRGWEWDDLSYYYAPEIGALSFNSNVVDLEVVADGQVGSTPSIQWFPFNTSYVEFINEQIITPPGTKYDESYRRVLGTNTIILRSTLPQGYYETEPLSVMEPDHYFIDSFSRYLEAGGIEVRGQLLTDDEYFDWSSDDLELFDLHRSVPLPEIVNMINRDSNNFYTEMLLKTVAEEEFNTRGSTELGLRLLKEYMHDTGFDTLSVTLRDASGMAPATLIKADDFNKFLANLEKESYFDHFMSSLSTGGVSGSLSHRFRNSPVRGKFYGKTGYVSGVRTLSGYLSASSGKWLTVTIFTNNYTASTSHVDFIHEKILEYLYSTY